MLTSGSNPIGTNPIGTNPRGANPRAYGPWLPLQQVANARLMLLQEEEPNSQHRQVLWRHVCDCYLKQGRFMFASEYGPGVDTGDVLFEGYLCRAAVLAAEPTFAWDWLDAEQPWQTPGLRASTTAGSTIQGPCQGVMWLGDLDLLTSPGLLPAAARAQFAGCTVLNFGAAYGPGGLGEVIQPKLGERISLVLKPERVYVIKAGDTIESLADRCGVTLQTMRKANPQLRPITSVISAAADTLQIIAGRHGTTEATLRSYNPALRQLTLISSGADDSLSSIAAARSTTVAELWALNPEASRIPAAQPLAIGTVLTVLALTPLTLLEPGQSLLVPAFLPAEALPVGVWVYLPSKREAVVEP